MKEPKCRTIRPTSTRTASGDVPDIRRRDVDPSTDSRAVVRIGDRPVVETGGEPATATPEPFIPALHSPDRDWDRADDYAMLGLRAYEDDMAEAEEANREARERGGW